MPKRAKTKYHVAEITETGGSLMALQVSNSKTFDKWSEAELECVQMANANPGKRYMPVRLGLVIQAEQRLQVVKGKPWGSEE